MTLRIFWPKTPHPGNLGDVLTPWLVKQISGEWPRHCTAGKRNSHLAIGSILRFAAAGVQVWGSGAMRRADRHSDQAVYHAVRGPYSRDLVQRDGGQCPAVYGDPAILLPRFHAEKIGKTHRLGIVPHYVDHAAAEAAYGNLPDTRVINVLRKNPLEVIDEIRACEAVVSSSLHGLIIAASYGIPAAWIGCVGENRLSGDGTKFADWFASVGRSQIHYAVSGRESAGDLQSYTWHRDPPSNLTPLGDSLLAACPFAKRRPPLVISFYTPKYEQSAQRLMADCRRVGVPHRIEAVPDRGEWIDNTRYKGEFVWKCLQEAKRPVLWIDADGRLTDFPELLAQPQGQIDFRARPKPPDCERPWYVGTLWFNDSPGGRLLAGTWAEQCRRAASGTSDELALTEAWRAWGDRVTAAALPVEYCTWPRDGDLEGRAIIAHQLSGEASKFVRRQARRQARAA